MRYIFGILILITIFGSGCVSVPKRLYEAKQMKLSTKKKERIPAWKVDDYVDDVVENVKGYEKPDEPVTDYIAFVYVGISGVLFLAGVACFAIAALSHMYKANIVGFICLIGSGVAAGFAAIANWWWTVPVAGAVGLVIWYLTHKTKDFSMFKTIKNWCGKWQ